MACDLERVFAPLAALVPDAEDSELSFSEATLPRPPAEMATGRLIIEKTYRAYDSYRCDALELYASKWTYCHLGLLIAAVLFSPDPAPVVLRLDHPASKIRRVVVRRDAAESPSTSGFHSRPHVLNYWPSVVQKHPWPFLAQSRPHELPSFTLTNTEECLVRESDWEARDMLVGFGSDEGFAWLVQLLLDVSRPFSTIDEIDLEGEGGFRGVAAHSCEVRLWLPGSIGWIARSMC